MGDGISGGSRISQMGTVPVVDPGFPRRWTGQTICAGNCMMLKEIRIGGACVPSPPPHPSWIGQCIEKLKNITKISELKRQTSKL